MKPSTILLAILPSLASAGCFSGGEAWDRSLAPDALNRACKNLAGNYRINEAHWKDINVKNGQCYHFVLQRISDGDDDELRSITEEECRDGMNNELSGCDNGGQSYYTNWMYKADPNKGPCQNQGE